VISYNLNGANKSTKNNALLPGCRPGVLLARSEKVFCLIRRFCGPSGRPSDKPAVRNQDRCLFRGNVKSFVFSEIHWKITASMLKNQTPSAGARKSFFELRNHGRKKVRSFDPNRIERGLSL
jgi:hypothetical protein